MSVVLAFVEHDAGDLEESSLEMLTLARKLASDADGSLEAIVFDDDDVAGAIGEYGVETVHVVDTGVDAYAPMAWGDSLAQLAVDVAAEAVVAPGTDRGHEIMAHAGASLDVPVAVNCTEVTVGDTYEVTRHRWGGSLMEHARLDAPTKLLTAAEHEFPIEPVAGSEPSVEAFTPDLDDATTVVNVERVEESDVEGVPLGEARVVVAGGRGVGGPEGYEPLEELASLLGGAVGASRAAINEGWRPHNDQIGLTGAKISPDIYIACGISGAVQHMVGCKGADVILAINTDQEAAIIQKGEYAVIGDLHEVVPALNDAIRARQ